MKEKLKKFMNKLVECLKKAAKKTKELIVSGLKKAVKWAAENPDKAASIGGMLVLGGKAALKAKKRHDEQVRIECRHYDRRSDTWSISTRPLKPAEKRELERRYCDYHERKSDILAEKGLLKY